MDLDFPDQRRYSRRGLTMPVTFFFKEEKTPSNYAFGQTLNVCLKGACIQTRYANIPDVEDSLILQLTQSTSSGTISRPIPYNIKTRVIWTDTSKRCFGVEFI